MKIISVPKIASAAEIDAQGSVIKIDKVNWPEFPYVPEVSCRLGHTSESIIVKFYVDEQHAQAACTEDNGAVWKDSCVEFFVKQPGSRFYFNFESNCAGALLAARRTGRDDAEHFTPQQLSEIVHVSSLERKELADRPLKWTLLLAVPFTSLGIEQVPLTLEANFYKCGDGTAIPHFLSWNPVASPKPDFHRPECFGKLFLL